MASDDGKPWLTYVFAETSTQIAAGLAPDRLVLLEATTCAVAPGREYAGVALLSERLALVVRC